jgi:AcrR family transcriptional regulator
MATEKRVRLNPDERRAQLIKLGVEMLATRTIDEVSVEDIAQQAGISRGLLFHYFSSKQEFHVEVARAAARELLRRTEPDPSLTPADSLRASLAAFVDYVEENPDNYTSLVRGAASGDAEMRAIFDGTRARLAGRVIAIVSDHGAPMSPRAELAVHGWVAFAEACVIGWLGTRAFGRDQLLDLLTRALPAVVLASSDEEIRSLVAILAPGAVLATK